MYFIISRYRIENKYDSSIFCSKNFRVEIDNDYSEKILRNSTLVRGTLAYK
jgi:hypothetical protein